MGRTTCIGGVNISVRSSARLCLAKDDSIGWLGLAVSATPYLPAGQSWPHRPGPISASPQYSNEFIMVSSKRTFSTAAARKPRASTL